MNKIDYEIRDCIKVIGSAEKKSTHIKGHDNITYTIGGNARHNTISKFIDWKLNENAEEIADIFNIENKPDAILQYLTELMNLSNFEFMNKLDKLLNLREPIIIQYRRLFYILIKINRHIIGSMYDDPVKFCPYEPDIRIKQLLELMPWDQVVEEFKITEETLNSLAECELEIKDLTDQIKDLKLNSNCKKESGETSEIYQQTPESKMDSFVDILKNCGSIGKIEEMYIRIAKKLETMSDLLESIL